MNLHIDAKKKTYVVWGLVVVFLGILVAYHYAKDKRIEEENAQQMLFEKREVKPVMRGLSAVGLKKRESDLSFGTEDIKQTLGAYRERVDGLAKECGGLYDYLREKAGSEQPESVCKDWRAKKERVKGLRAEIARVGQEGQDAYERQVAEWEAAATKVDAEVQTRLDEVRNLERRATKLYGRAAERRKNVEQGEKAYYGYTNDTRKLKRGILSVRAKLKKYEAEQADLIKAKNSILGEDGKVNPEAPAIKDIVALLGGLRPAIGGDVDALQEPTIKPEPPPPPMVADLSIATTGDLAEELAKPLVEGWLTERGATPLQGNSFVWNTPDEVTMEIEVNAPASIQGRDAGKLRVRIITERDAGGIFSWLHSGRERADLVLTGRNMSNAQRGVWLPKGRTLDDFGTGGKGTYRSRVCSDALLFFPGEGSEIECLNAETRNKVAKVYSRDDAGRMEAASIFGFTPGGRDAVADDTGGRSIDSLRGQYRDHIILGTWHRDSRRSDKALRPVRGHELSYSSGISMDSDRVASAYRRFLQEYRNKGCHPSEPTINAGRYAYAYDINFYRSTAPKREAAAGEDLLAWAGDAKSEKLATLVRGRGFVPVMPKEPNADDQLTNEDLPIDRLLQKLPSDFGYTRDETVWVRGTRFDIPLFYRVGDSKVAVDPTYVSGVTKALEYMRKLTKGRRACLVLVGHADPQYGKKLDAGERSWNFNDKLSRERADVIYTDFFSKECPDSSTLTHVTLGCSWALPVRDIDLSKGIEEQEGALDRCRRVEVFVVFPLADEEESAGED